MNFSSISYFSRYVKNTLGTTPTEYRKAIKNEKRDTKDLHGLHQTGLRGDNQRDEISG